MAATTRIKAVHITELRDAIGTLRSRYSLGAYSWTDATLTPGTLAEVYTAASRTQPTYTHTTITAGTTSITATDIAELRAAVLAIW